MGLNISEMIPKKEISWESLDGKKIAIDASQMLYQFLSSIRQLDGKPLSTSEGKITSHLVGLSSRIPRLIEKGLKLCFVFDGKPPELKNKEKEMRSERKEEAFRKYEKSEDESEMLKYAKQSTRLSQEMVDEAKELVEVFGLPVVQAPSEAEAQCAVLCKKGDVDYVSSTDYDVFLYGAPNVVRNLTLSVSKSKENPLEVVELKSVLRSLDLEVDELIVMGILVGTDYNRAGVKGIGQKKALQVIKNYKGNWKLMFRDLGADFDWEEVYNVFNEMPVEEDVKLEWKAPDYEKIKEILVKENEFNEERVDKMLERLEAATKKKTEQKGLGEFV